MYASAIAYVGKLQPCRCSGQTLEPLFFGMVDLFGCFFCFFFCFLMSNSCSVKGDIQECCVIKLSSVGFVADQKSNTLKRNREIGHKFSQAAHCVPTKCLGKIYKLEADLASPDTRKLHRSCHLQSVCEIGS